MDTFIFTEGQTDWIHLKKAAEKLKIKDRILFWEAEEERGEDKMYKMCEFRAKAPNKDINIFIFDRDNPNITNKVNQDGSYKSWGNNVFSFSIPVPYNRKGKTSLSIEFYYDDDVFLLSDKNGRRVFLSNEFDPTSGLHLTDKKIHISNRHEIKQYVTLETSKVIDHDVFNSEGLNLALSKSQFANYIQKEVIPYNNINFKHFNLIFNVIKEIINKTTAENLELYFDNKRYRTDSPPIVDIFVGRSNYIEDLLQTHIRVSAITGLGGEGKSTLAAKVYKKIVDKNSPIQFEKTAWVDCKEEETPFHEKLMNLLEYLTDGKHTSSMYAEENMKDTVSRSLEIFNAVNSFVVFDNVDPFVDKDKAMFTGPIKTLFDQLVTKLLKSYVIFTCRSSINDHHHTFLEIPVQGLTYNETIELAIQFGFDINDNNKNFFRKIFDKTDGHVLWLNLIFGQLKNKRLTNSEIDNIISKQTSLLDHHLLNSIWEHLNNNEKEVINIVGTFTRPHSIKKIEKLVPMTYQKCRKVINTLIRLRLITEIDKLGQTYYDLHPIIRLKARQSLTPQKRRLLVVKIVKSLGDWGKYLNKEKFFDDCPSDLDDYIECAEIALENDQYDDALLYLDKLSSPMLKYGLDVKFIELCDNYFKIISPEHFNSEVKGEFYSLYRNYIETLLRLDDNNKVDLALEHFKNSIVSIKDYIVYAEVKGYSLWYQNQFESAIGFLEECIKKIKEKGENVPYGIYYDIALSNRDMGNITSALNYFLEKTPLQKIEDWNPSSEEEDIIYTDIGNISRCFYLLGQYELSLKYCLKVNKFLEKGKNRDSKVNYGYSLLWLANSYYKLNEIKLAKYNIEKAIEVWGKYCPSRLKMVLDHIKSFSSELQQVIQVTLERRIKEISHNF